MCVGWWGSCHEPLTSEGSFSHLVHGMVTSLIFGAPGGGVALSSPYLSLPDPCPLLSWGLVAMHVLTRSLCSYRETESYASAPKHWC